MNTLVFAVLLATFFSTVTSEVEDVTVIFRIHNEEVFPGLTSPDSSTASVEIHLGTNALGRPMKIENGSYLDPFIGMPQFHCIPAVPDCTWGLIGNWAVKSVDIKSILEHFDIHSTTNNCQKMNGGCQIYCQPSENAEVCSCPPGYSLNLDFKTCSGARFNNHILTGNSGTFSSPNFPNSYDNGHYITWLVAASPHHRITLDFLTFRTEGGYDILEVYDGPSNTAKKIASYSGISYRTPLKSTGNTMLITFSTDASRVNQGFSIRYTTEFIGQPVFSLSDNSGSLRSLPFVHQSLGLCVYIIYKLEPSSKVWVSADLGHHGSLNLTEVVVRKAGEWQIGRFLGTLTPEQTGKSVTLSAYFSGLDSSVFSIEGCNPFDEEDVYVLSNSYPVKDLKNRNTPQSFPATSEKCYNGGVYLDTAEACACPAGFMGSDCREGCGPNHYGSDCKRTCSVFERGCHKMMLCSRNLPCMCAPGFTGQLCDTKCSLGHYGANCGMPCGHCTTGSCDIYTGECESGCEPGYYPPYCQETYRSLSEAPRIDYKDISSALLSANGSSLVGRGSVKFYQVQYKEEDGRDWIELQPRELTGGTILANLTNLKAGTQHAARIILIDSDGNSNRDIGVPTVEFQTSCLVPTSKEYHLKSDKITSSSFEVSWKYDDLTSTSCPVKGFEITFNDRWEKYHHNLTVEREHINFTGLLPGRTYTIQVKALTDFGATPSSSVLNVRTQDNAPGVVTNLKAIAMGPGEVLVSWSKPRISGGTIRRYFVEYECLHLLACSLSCNHSRGNIKVSSPSVVLTGLHPHAQYKIKVAGLSATQGPFKTILAATRHTGASIAPDVSLPSVIHRTNTSIAVQWAAPTNCSWLNGYLYGYQYQLVTKYESRDHILLTGDTQDTRVNLTDLIPHTQYEVHVYLVTSGGWSASHKLVIPVMTSATAPEQVQNLTVYKRGRRLIGVRWAPPLQSYGPIRSFTVIYQPKDHTSSSVVRTSIEPMHCTAWPNMYCHTINELVPETEYVVSIQARNMEVDTDGASASITAITREAAPDAPTSLQVLNRTQTSMLVEWSPPSMINGMLRSFLVNVEETDSSNSSTCCEYFPIQELPVRTEEQLYRLEVGGLTPASTLTISVSAKTLTMGPAVNITASTPPEPPAIVYPPELQPKASEDELFSVSLRPSEAHPGLQSTYLFVILPPEARPEPLIWDKDLLIQLKEVVNASFYSVAEFTSEALTEEEELSVGTGAPLRNGTIGALEDPVLLPGSYRVGLALILDYCGSKSVGFAASDFFEVSKCTGAESCSVPLEY